LQPPCESSNGSFQDFKLPVLQQLLGEDYLLIQIFVKPSDIGLSGIARHRTYIFCAHRETCRYLVDVHQAYRVLCKVLRKRVSTRPRDYLVATPQQVQADALRIAQDRKVEFKVETWHFQKVTVSPLTTTLAL
jgi:hypothetical protein